MRVKIDAHATSTAIIYAKSVNEQYDCALSSLNDLSSKDTQYYDKKGMIRHITHAYNNGTTKQYFRTSPSKRTCNFYDYVVDAYTQEIRKILGAKIRLKYIL